MRRRAKTSMALALAALLLVPACAGEDRPAQVEVIGGAGVVSISGADEGPGGVPSGIRYTTTAANSQEIAFQASLDLQNIRSMVNVAIDGRPVDWPSALAIYEKGRNQKQADGSLRSLASLATDSAHAVFPNGRAVYGDDRFLDTTIRDALNGTGSAQGLSDDVRRAQIDRGIQTLLYANALRALAEAKTRVDAKAANSGATIDEAWGFVAGVTDVDGGRTRSLLQTGIDHETHFKLTPGKLSRPLEAAFITALAGAQKGDAATFDKYAAEGRGGLNAIFYLSTLRAAKTAEADTSEAARASHLAEGRGYFQAIRAQVASASPAAAEAVQAAYTRPTGQAFPASETQRIYAALNEPAVLTALGIPTAVQVKTPPAGS